MSNPQITPSKSASVDHVEKRYTEMEGHDLGGSTIDSSPLDNEHRQLLLRLHGTYHLTPLPSASLRDPLNWSGWKKNCHLFLVAFHAMSFTFMASGIEPGTPILAERYGISITTAAYLISAQIVVSGILPLFWTPLANRYGRRPILMLSAVGSCACNIGGGFCISFGSQMVTRILTAAMICPPLAIGSGAVAEMFFSHQRAAKMGWWTLLLTVGLPGGSFIMGFVVGHAGPDWPFYIFAIMNFLLFLGHFFLNAETLYRPSRDYSDTRGGIFEYKRIDKTPIIVSDFLSPLACAKHLDIIIPTIAYSVVFNFAGAIIIEMPAVMYKLFAFNPQQIGLQFVPLIIGSLAGFLVGGTLSDMFMAAYSRRGHSDPSHRLWLSYPGFITAMTGYLVWGIQLQNATPGAWNVTFDVGIGICGFGIQLITNTLITFAVDNHRHISTDIGLLVNLVRQTWTFIGPFYFPPMVNNLGFATTSGVFCVIIFSVSLVPILILHFLISKRAISTL